MPGLGPGAPTPTLWLHAARGRLWQEVEMRAFWFPMASAVTSIAGTNEGEWRRRAGRRRLRA